MTRKEILTILSDFVQDAKEMEQAALARQDTSEYHLHLGKELAYQTAIELIKKED